MKYIELFAGVGGFRSALDKLDFECVFASEIDKYAIKSYKALYGHEPSSDITKIHAEDIPEHDLLVGGFPCQAFSVAGQRKGFEDTRGTLFFEIVRITDAKRPKWLMLENVKGLLSHDGGRTFEIMCATLNDIGYAIDFKVLNSKHYGVPQNRERIFIMANRDAAHEDWLIEGNDVVAKAKKRIQAMGVKTFNFDYPKNDTVDKRLRDVLQEQVNEKFYLSKEKTEKLIYQLNEKRELEPQVNVIGSLEYYNFDCMNRVHDANGLSPTIQTLQGGSREPKIAVIGTTLDTGAKGTNSRSWVYDSNGLSKTIDAGEYKQPMQHIDGVAIREATKIGYDVAYEGDSVNIVHPDSETRRGSVGKQIANTLETNCNQGVVQQYRIRKLTPLECFRLQGFTDEQFYKCKDAGVSDSQLYKQAGNAVTVNVIEILGTNLKRYLKQEVK